MICAVLLGVALTASAAPPPRDPAKYTRVLLPVSGPHNAWQAIWWFRNDGDTPADAFPLALGGGLPPPPDENGETPAYIVPNPALAPHSNLTALGGDALPTVLISGYVPLMSSAPGAFVFVEAAHEPQVTFAGSVQWVFYPRASPAAMQPIPERAFLSGTASIVAIPHDANRRYAIRIYALPETIASPHLTISIYEMQPVMGGMTGEDLLRRIDAAVAIPTTRFPSCLGPCDLPKVAYAPAVAEVFDLVGPRPEPWWPSTLRIEITPDSPDLRWWAVVSATDAQQNVTLYTPPFRMTSR